MVGHSCLSKEIKKSYLVFPQQSCLLSNSKGSFLNLVPQLCKTYQGKLGGPAGIETVKDFLV